MRLVRKDAPPRRGALEGVLAHELSHIALGHRLDTKYAFDDRMFFPDEDTFARLDFNRNAADEEAADKRALELLAKSPYKDKLGNAGLFLKALQARAPELKNLIRAHLGNSLASSKSMRMSPRVRHKRRQSKAQLLICVSLRRVRGSDVPMH